MKFNTLNTRTPGPRVIRATSLSENQNEVTVTQVRKASLVEKPTQVGSELSEEHKLHVRRVTEQDSSVALESRAVEGLEKGYTRIPNPVLMRLVTGDFTRNEIKVALIIARFTISFRREFAPLSKKVLERQTGLRGAAILDAVSGLVKKGLIQKQQGNQYRPNMLGLILPEAWEGPDRPTKKESETDKGNAHSKDTRRLEAAKIASHPVAEIPPHPQVVTSTQGEVPNSTLFKDINKYKNNNSLSELPKFLQDYFQNLKPLKKRESEWKVLQELRQDYQVQDIVDCFALLKGRGVRAGQSGEFQACHSPMAYLSKAMNGVLQEVVRARKMNSLNETRISRDAQQKKEELELKKLEAQQWLDKAQAFERAYPSPEEQQAKINEICRNRFNPTQIVGRIFAISEWWKTIECQQTKVATC